MEHSDKLTVVIFRCSAAPKMIKDPLQHLLHIPRIAQPQNIQLKREGPTATLRHHADSHTTVWAHSAYQAIAVWKLTLEPGDKGPGCMCIVQGHRSLARRS